MTLSYLVGIFYESTKALFIVNEPTYSGTATAALSRAEREKNSR